MSGFSTTRLNLHRAAKSLAKSKHKSEEAPLAKPSYKNDISDKKDTAKTLAHETSYSFIEFILNSEVIDQARNFIGETASKLTNYCFGEE